MPRTPRVVALAGTMHVVARGNSREVLSPTGEDFAIQFVHLWERVRTDAGTGSASRLLSNHMHLPLQAPTHEALGRRLW